MRDGDRRVDLRMPHELWEALAVIAHGQHVTVATLLRQGAYALLAHYRQQDPAQYGALTGGIRDPEERPTRRLPVRT